MTVQSVLDPKKNQKVWGYIMAELTSNDFLFHKTNYIEREFSSAYTPQQNGLRNSKWQLKLESVLDQTEKKIKIKKVWG